MDSPDEIGLVASVGRGSPNRIGDVVLVQWLLNRHQAEHGALIVIDGECGPSTITAIEAVQKVVLAPNAPDGRIDPHGLTLRVLNEAERTPAATPSVPTPKPAVNPPPALPSGLTQELIDAARASKQKWQVPASVTLAQWALESSWGRHVPPDSFNPFGIKALEGQAFVETLTHEFLSGHWIVERQRFRKFASFGEAFDLHGDLLATQAVYRKAQACAMKADDFAQALTGIYATDPTYGNKLCEVMRAHNFYQYDL